MAWTILLIAGLFEILWAAGLKYCHGFTRLWPSVLILTAMAASVYFLSVAMKSLPLSTAYAVWTGIGVCGSVIAGVILFGDPMSAAKIICFAMIIGGIIGLKLLS